MNAAFRIFVGIFVLGMCNFFFEIHTLLFLKSTNGVVTKAEIKEKTSKVSRSSQHITYLAADINFEYEVNKNKYIGTSVFFPKMTNSGITDESNNIHKNAVVKVWYDTRNPSDAWLFFSPFAIFFTAISLLSGLVFLLNEMLIIRKKWRQMHEDISPLNSRKH